MKQKQACFRMHYQVSDATKIEIEQIRNNNKLKSSLVSRLLQHCFDHTAPAVQEDLGAGYLKAIFGIA